MRLLRVSDTTAFQGWGDEQGPVKETEVVATWVRKKSGEHGSKLKKKKILEEVVMGYTK